MLYLKLLILLLSLQAIAQDSLISLSFGPAQIGEAPLPINLQDFDLVIKGEKEKINAVLLPDSVQWIRNAQNLLTPRARILVEIKDLSANYHLRYLGKSITLQTSKNSQQVELFVPLFNPGEIEVYQSSKKVSGIRIHSVPPKNGQETKLIDHSCAKYQVDLQGLEGEYHSVGCRVEPIGNVGSEVPRLEVTWSATNYILPDGSQPPYISVLKNNDPVHVTLQDAEGVDKKVTIIANLPTRLHRLKTAIGFGPYSFYSKDGDSERSPRPAPSFMLYGNLQLTNTSSIRGFNATLWQETLFNNAGAYFAYELADAFDKRISLVPLLGVQLLSFNYHAVNSIYSKIIYPQGFEVLYSHAFGIKNYSLVYGMFFSPTGDQNYKNLWLRFGKRVFAELNYIDWKDEVPTKRATMWGLSVGIPFVSLF